MKKIIAVLFAVVLALGCFAAVSAEGAVNTYEKDVLDYLGQEVKLGKTTYIIPAEYVNQAKNYFLTIDMTEQESKDIIAALNGGLAALKAAALPDKEFDMKVLPYATKQAVLASGQNACAVIGLNLVYNTTTEKVVITKGENTVLDSAPTIKTTGAAIDMTVIVVTMAALLAVAGAMVLVSKKARLF